MLAVVFVPAVANAGPWGLVTGGKDDQVNAVCAIRLQPGDPAEKVTGLQIGEKTFVPAQVVKPSLLQGGEGSYLVFVVPKLKAGDKLPIGPAALPNDPVRFRFDDDGTLFHGGRRVLGYFHPPHDPADHYYTFKPFHHVYDPVEGKTLLTNGSAKTDKDGQFPHHRGLFFGWNRISYDDKTADIWHGTERVFSQHDKMLDAVAGPVLARQRAAISWHGKDGATFITEERELTAYDVRGGTLLDFASVLTTDRPSVKLDGDPQHAGFHFRANMEVSKNGKENTYYLRPDGKGKIGETRNWEPAKPDPKKKGETTQPDKRTINLPWNAMSFVVGGKRYTLLRMNHPDNPKESRGSERDYGRFGDYFEYTLTPEKPLKVKYRIWVQEGEMTVEQCAAMASAFAAPPEAKIFGAAK
jgi:hypothetical protein